MPFDTHRLYQAERVTSWAEIQHAHDQVRSLAAAASALLRYLLARPVATAVRRLASWRNGAQCQARCADLDEGAVVVAAADMLSYPACSTSR